jgi:hypothetical protein
MKKFIVAAAVIGVVSLAGVKSVQAQVPSRVSGTYPGAYGTYPSQQYPDRYPNAEHGRRDHDKKHHAKKHEQGDNDHDADDARYGQYGQYGTSGYPNGTYGYPSSNAPSRVQPEAGYGRYNVPSRTATPQPPIHSRDRDGHWNDRDR